MLIKVFKSKIHRAMVTESNLEYKGSLTIAEDLMMAANIHQYEAVWVWNVNNGSRLMTYAIKGESGSGVICLNGSAARLGHAKDRVIITTFADMTEEEANYWQPIVVAINEDSGLKNKIEHIIHE